MNKEILKGKWDEVKGKIKQKWGKLTDDDITTIKGSYDELMGRLEKNYGYNKEQAAKELNQFLKDNDIES